MFQRKNSDTLKKNKKLKEKSNSELQKEIERLQKEIERLNLDLLAIKGIDEADRIDRLELVKIFDRVDAYLTTIKDKLDNEYGGVSNRYYEFFCDGYKRGIELFDMVVDAFIYKRNRLYQFITDLQLYSIQDKETRKEMNDYYGKKDAWLTQEKDRLTNAALSAKSFRALDDLQKRYSVMIGSINKTESETGRD